MKGKAVGRIAAAALTLALSAGGVVPAQTDLAGKYRCAGVTEAGEIAYPVNANRPGMVTLDVSVGASGAVQQIVVTGDVPPLKSAAENAVKGWKFSPAIVGGQPAAGVGRVNVVFNPFNPGGVIIPTKPLAPADMPEVTSRGFWPAAVKTAKYAVYPANTVSSGTVVLDVKVGSDGKVANVRMLRGARALSGAVTRVIKDWEFVPASYEGRAVESHTSVAFVFVSPAVGTM